MALPPLTTIWKCCREVVLSFTSIKLMLLMRFSRNKFLIRIPRLKHFDCDASKKVKGEALTIIGAIYFRFGLGEYCPDDGTEDD